MDEGGARAVAAVILAAGSSVRMGSPKQVLRFGGESLLRRTARAALAAGCEPVVVVTGAYADACEREVEGLDVQIVLNADWQTGMSSSVRAGIRRLGHADVDAAVLLVCDQPHLTATVVSGLLATYRARPRPVIASSYGGGLGVPALFSRQLFSELLGVEGLAGAKAVIEKHAREADFVPFPGGGVDIDTPEDFLRLGGRTPS
jgi:molybdenum cofactor cytidylyltransferase